MGNYGLQSIIARNEEITAANMDGEVVMMNIDTGNYYNLGRTGSVIWNLLEEPVSVESLIDKLTDIYQVGRTQCEEELQAFLTELSREGLVIIR